MPAIKNKTKKAIIATNARVCNSILSRAVGLMFSLKPRSLIFIFEKEKTIPLHMFFVFFPIDIVFLNKNKIVVELKEIFKPFTIYAPKEKAMYIIELPKNTIKKAKIGLGDEIEF